MVAADPHMAHCAPEMAHANVSYNVTLAKIDISASSSSNRRCALQTSWTAYYVQLQ